MRRRSSATRTAIASLAACLLGTNAGSGSAATATPSAMAAPILRIELENFDQMQFFGKVSVGSPPQEFRVIFDTGSSDVWLADTDCDSCASFARRYTPTKSSTFASSANAFRLEYGSGVASGLLMQETLRLGGALEIAHVQMGRVNVTTDRLRYFHADGIVGLGLEALGLITKPGLFTSGESTLLSMFSIYINPLPSSSPPSQLILGGADPAITTLVLSDTAPQWHFFPLVPYPETRRLGFWSIRMHDMKIDGGDNSIADAGSETNRTIVSSGATVIVDSGTSLILLPPRVFNATIGAIVAHLHRAHDTELVVNSAAISGFTCKGCSPRMFPALVFTFDATTFHLQGTDYVRCDGTYCSPQLDSHSLFSTESTHSTATVPKPEEDVIVLGAVFLRAYYTVFDARHARVGFACASDGCRGGRLPELRFAGDPLFGGSAMRARVWRGVYYATSAMLVLVAIALLWQLLTPPSPLHDQTRRRKSTNGDCEGEAEPEDEPSPWSSAAPEPEDSSSSGSRHDSRWALSRGSSFGMELLRRLSSALAITVVVTSGSDSEEESARSEPDRATFRDDDLQAATERDVENCDDRAFQTHDEGPVRILTADPEPLDGTTVPRLRKSSVCLDA